MKETKTIFKYNDGTYFKHWDSGHSTQYYTENERREFSRCVKPENATDLSYALKNHYIDDYTYYLKDGAFIDIEIETTVKVSVLKVH